MRNRSTITRSMALALGVFTLFVAWGFSSPPGSTPDDDFHTVSILCASGDNEFCQILETDADGNPIKAVVPLRTANTCFATSFPSENASCVAQQQDKTSETNRINVNHVSGVYYSIMNRFLSSDYEASIRSMRIFNAFLFSALLLLALLTSSPGIWRGLTLMTMTSLIPFAAFFVPSINPSSWAITGILFSWVFLYSLVNVLRQPLNWRKLIPVLTGLFISIVIALSSRKDTQVYLVVIAAATAILIWPRFNTRLKWIIVAVTAALGTIVWVLQAENKLRGFTQVLLESFISPRVIIESIIEMPSVVAGTIGLSAPAFRNIDFFYYGIGGAEIQMPASVALITLTTLAGLIFTFIPYARKRQVTAVFFVIVIMLVIQIYYVAASLVNNWAPTATPRYMVPLFLVAVVMYFSIVKINRSFPSRGQAAWLFIAMPLASAIALLTTIRRYTNGQTETWVQLFFEPIWWWEDFPLDPTVIWFLGVAASLLVAYMAVRILRDPEPKPQTINWRKYTSLTVFAFSWLFSLVSAWSLLRLPSDLNPAANLFRGYFPNDQLSYAGISASAKQGEFGLVEPFTQTGASFYPSWWYKIIGQFANWSGMEIPAAWSFLGLVIVLGSIGFIGIAAFRITRRAWAPLVLGVLLWLGPLSSVLFGNWYVNLDSHAVMWGPYGALYPLNGEAIGLSVGLAAFTLGYWVLRRPEWKSRKRLILLGISGLGLGVTANFQTYSFLTLAAVTFWTLAVSGLIRSKSRSLVVTTLMLLLVVLLMGPLLRGTIGAMPVYALMLVPTFPGMWFFMKKQAILISGGLIAFAIGAAPQVLWLVSGTLAKDPFLTYRVDQSGDLGVPLWAFLLIGSPIVVTWAAILWAQILRRGVSEIALLVGWFIAFVLLTFNNLWGFGQEPYRFWIDSVIVFVVIATLTLPNSISTIIQSSVRLRVLSALAIVLVGVSAWNVGGFRNYVSSAGDIDFDAPRFQAITEIVAVNTMSQDLITAEPCIDPRVLKVLTGSRVAFYNLGLAWPENKAAIDAVIDAGNAGAMDIDMMRNAGISYLLTDSSCPTIWYPGGNMGTAQVGSVEYSDGQGIQRLDLWRIL